MVWRELTDGLYRHAKRPPRVQRRGLLLAQAPGKREPRLRKTLSS